MQINLQNEQELRAFGIRFGAALAGGETIELRGDVGAGKTTLTKAIAAGMGAVGDVSSPSYALSQTYEAARGLRLAHYDFYRLDDPGILASELAEVVGDTHTVVVIEWAKIVSAILPDDCLHVTITPTSETSRRLDIEAIGPRSQAVLEQLV